MCLLSTTLLFTTCNVNTQTPWRATEVVKNSNTTVFQTKELGLIKTDLEVQLEKDKIEFEKERLRKQKELEEQKRNEPKWQEYILTFYTSLDMENGYGAITSQGRRLSRGGVANNVIPQNTKIHLDGWGEVIVNDKGSNKHFSVDTRLDVFIERESGESDSQYLRRVNSYGVQRVKGYIVNEVK
jgi:3D (Asp-Asp-Asp) domain-containing protein